MAIVAVLGTLLLTTLASVQKKSRQARCTSNLRQISLALNMYLDDFDARSSSLATLAATKYLAHRDVLLCPSDRTGRWGNLVNADSPGLPWESGAFEESRAPAAAPEPIAPKPVLWSYLHPLNWTQPAWEQLAKQGGAAGLAACQLHGLAHPSLDQPSVFDYEGLILRARRDGAVVRRTVFWTAPHRANDASALASAPALPGNPTLVPEADAAFWPLFSDEPSPPP